MADITLLGRITSANVQKVMWTLEEIGLSYQQTEMGGKFGGLGTPEYLAMNPNSFVPTLRDGALTMWESHAIVRYLAATYSAGDLWPEDTRTRAIVDQWTDWVSARFQPSWLGVFTKVVRVPADMRDAGAIREAVVEAEKCFSIMDARLEHSEFLGGDRLTYADIVAGVAMHRWTTMEIERAPMPGVEAWHRRLLSRPAFVKTVNTSYDDLRA